MNAASVKERLSRLDSCAVSDSLDKLGLSGAVSGLLPMTAITKICGRVITVKLVAKADLPNKDSKAPHLGARAIEQAEAGDVIVVEQRTGIVAGSWGGILSVAAKVRGVAGVISEGLVRDVDEARLLNFPIYARGSTAQTARGRVAELETGGEVCIGEVTVHSGDYVLADQTGVVFVGSERISEVLDVAEQIAAREAIMTKSLMQGNAVTQVMAVNYEEMLKS